MNKGCDCMAFWGTQIERGKITEKTGSGSSAVYTVESYDRPGLSFSGLSSAGAEMTAGAKVCFFAFGDGTGKILCAL